MTRGKARLLLIFFTTIVICDGQSHDFLYGGIPPPNPPFPPQSLRPTGDLASRQLEDWAEQHPESQAGTVRDEQGCPVPSLTASLAIGNRGHVLLQDIFLLNELANFNRERLPERVVHAKGHGAFGYFRVTHDISTLTKADFLNGIGKITPIFIRFSTVAGSLGSVDSLREARGFALKFYTLDGIFDLVGNVARVFPIRDPMLFNDLNKSRKPNPQTHVVDPTMRWDFSGLRPETLMHNLITFSDYGINSRVINGGGVHAFKFVNKQGVPVFVKFHFISQQPFLWWNQTEIEMAAGLDPDYATRDLFNAIANHDYPKWTLKIQVMTAEQAMNYPVNPFDTTKLWREEEFPLIPVGEFVLNQNPTDYFNDVEQAALSPERLVPGIEPSPDRMLHARMFSYPDAQRYRLGINFAQLDVNKPKFPVKNYMRDGFMRNNPNGGGGPNYFPNSFHGPTVNSTTKDTMFHVNGIVDRFDTVGDIADTFQQARLYLYKDLNAAQRKRCAENVGKSLAKANKGVREMAFRNLFAPITEDFAKIVWDTIQATIATNGEL